MAISKKGKRKITVGLKKYFWWVFDEYDQSEFDGIQIKIVSENQIGYIKYGLQQSEKERYVVISLKDEKYKIHILSPKFEDKNGIIKPSGIEKLINWSLDDRESLSQVIVHGYNTSIGIIPEEDRFKTLGLIINKLKTNYD